MNLALALCLVSFVVTPLSSQASPGPIRTNAIPDTPVTNFTKTPGVGMSQAIAPDGSMYLGGDIESVNGTVINSGAVSINSDGDTSSPDIFTGIPQHVQVAISDDNGGWFLAGYDSFYPTSPNYLIRHVLDTGNIDSNFQLEINNSVTSMIFDIDSDTLYLSGDFTSVNIESTPVTRNRIAAFDGTTGIATSFDPDVGSRIVEDIELDKTNRLLYATGEFSSVNNNTTSVSQNSLVAFNIDTSVVTGFDPDIPFDADEIELNGAGTIIYVAGFFGSVNNDTTPITRNALAAFDTTTSVATGFDPDLDLPLVDDMEFDESTNTVFVSGDFTSVNNNSTPLLRNGLAGFNGTTGVATSFDPRSDELLDHSGGCALSVDPVNQKIYINGDFYSVSDEGDRVERSGIASYSTTTGLVENFDPIVSMLTHSDIAIDPETDKLLLTGFVAGIGGTRQNGIVHINSDGTIDTNFNPDIHGWVQTIALDPDSQVLYAGGLFTTVNSNSTPVTRNNLAAFDTTTGTATDFNPDIGGSVLDIELDNTSGVLYTAGTYSNVNNGTTPVARNSVAAFNTSTSIATDFNPDVNANYIGDMELDISTNTFYLAGGFTSVNLGTTPVTRNRLAAFDMTTSVATAFNPDVNGQYALKIKLDTATDTLYAVGNFTNVNNGTTPVARNGIAAFNTDTSVATDFDPDPDGPIYGIAIAENENTLFLGGLFTSLNNNTTPVPRSGYGAVDLTSSLAKSFNPSIEGIAGSFSVDPINERLYISGIFFPDVGNLSSSGALIAFGVPFDSPDPQESTTTTGASPTTTVAPTVPTTTLSVATTKPQTQTTQPQSVPSTAAPTIATTTPSSDQLSELIKSALGKQKNNHGKSASKSVEASKVSRGPKSGNSQIVTPLNIAVFIILLIIIACIVTYEIRQKAKKKRESLVAPVGGDWLRRHEQ